jgi:hypothetical protein
MPKFAYFNPASNPAPVIDWIDTDAGEWPSLPGSDYLIEVTPAQWAARNDQAWQVYGQQVVAAPGIGLVEAKAAQLALIDATYDTASQAPVAYMGTTFQADEISQRTLGRTISAVPFGSSLPTGFSWLDNSNNPVTMNRIQLQGLAAAVLAQVFPLFQHKQTRKAAIRAAATVADVQSITW